jgi:hypothetical protein
MLRKIPMAVALCTTLFAGSASAQEARSTYPCNMCSWLQTQMHQVLVGSDSWLRNFHEWVDHMVNFHS